MGCTLQDVSFRIVLHMNAMVGEATGFTLATALNTPNVNTEGHIPLFVHVTGAARTCASCHYVLSKCSNTQDLVSTTTVQHSGLLFQSPTTHKNSSHHFSSRLTFHNSNPPDFSSLEMLHQHTKTLVQGCCYQPNAKVQPCSNLRTATHPWFITTSPILQPTSSVATSTW